MRKTHFHVSSGSSGNDSPVTPESTAAGAGTPSGSSGFSVVEIIVVMAIFLIILGGIFSAYLAQLKTSTTEYKFAETDIDIGIARNILERDISTAGYGLADDYTADPSIPLPVALKANNGNPDELTLTGTSLGTSSRTAQAWTYLSGIDGVSGLPTFHAWNDSREDIRVNSDTAKNDAVILIEPTTKKLLTQGTSWLFKYSGSPANLTTLPCGTNAGSGVTYGTPTMGTLVYGLQRSDNPKPAVPYYTVLYKLDSTRRSANCNSGTFALTRAETTSTSIPNGDPVLQCVLDMEVAFGLDTDGNGTIDVWDDGGTEAATYTTNKKLLKNLKQVRVYMLVQSGNYDPLYTYPAASVRVGDSNLAVGRTIPINGNLSHYRWKMVNLNITPRNVR